MKTEQKKRVLIAEDTSVSRQVLQTILEDCGYEVLSVADGNEAWGILEREDAPQLVVLDWMMPGIEGIQLCRRIRQREHARPTYVILVTGRAAKADMVEGLDAGADDYLAKPYDTNELRARIRVAERTLHVQASLNQKISELHAAAERIRVLQAILPTCQYCRKIRKADSEESDPRAWVQMEDYIREQTGSRFSHGICPECMHAHHPEVNDAGPEEKEGPEWTVS